jgi:VanZ family protein
MSRRGRLAALTLFFAACAAYGSFVPLVWRDIAWREGLDRFWRMPFTPLEHLWTGDFFTNILVFLPIAFFATGWVTSRRADLKVCATHSNEATQHAPTVSDVAQTFRSAGLIVTACALFSAFLELGQIYIAARTSSWSDIFAQTLGAILGVAVWAAAGARLVTWAASPLRAASRADRVHQLLVFYAAVWLVLSALPLFFPRLAHPQLYSWREQLDVSQLMLLGPLLVAGLAAVPLGALGALVARRLEGSWKAIVVAASGPVLLVVADIISQEQLLPTRGHRLAGLAGFSAGWMVLSPLGDRVRAWASRRRTLVFAGGLAALSGLLVLQYWAPFNFGVRPAALEFRTRILYERAPLHRYYWAPPLVALGEVVQLLLLAGLFGALIRGVSSSRRRLPVAACSLLTAVVFTVIEWGQLSLPARRADPTDVMIAAAGALIGAIVARALEHDGSS